MGVKAGIPGVKAPLSARTTSSAAKSGPVAPKTRHVYMKYWSEDYEASADVDLVVGKSTLPVHRHVLSVSDVFSKDLRPTSTTPSSISTRKRVRVQTEVKGVTKENMILLLSHVYTTDAHLSAENIGEVRLLVDLANQFGFRAVSAKCMSVLTTDKKFLEAVREDLDGMDPDVVAPWLCVAQKASGPALKKVVAKFLGSNYFTIFGREPAVERKGAWSEVANAVTSDTELLRMVSHNLAQAYEDKPQRLDFGFDRNYAAVYGVGFGLFVGFIVPGWFLMVAIFASIFFVGRKYSQGLQHMVDNITRGVMRKLIQQCVQNVGSQPFMQEMHPNNGKMYYHASRTPQLELLE
ncbi:hypothetical protein BSKO_06877 [Bryopsis sp. KO-2023]|nr:hypothetical protein BSKO_06877 [Bryopsis sp. KO-2023]